MEKMIYTKNIYHLGDNIFCCIFFNKIKEYIENNNIYINHYCLSVHLDQIKEFIYCSNIKILPLEEQPSDVKIIDTWIGSPEYQYNYFNSNTDQYDIFLKNFYNNLLNVLNIPITIDRFVFENNEFLIREAEINNETNDYFKNIDILIINGEPKSGQLEYNKDVWDSIITKISKNKNVVTSQKVDGIKCTRDYNLTARDVASIAIYAKQIIAIDSGLAAGLYNKFVIKNVEVVYYLCDHNKCHNSFSNFVKKNNITDFKNILYEDEIEGMSVIDCNLFSNVDLFYLFIIIILLIIFLCRVSFTRLKIINRLWRFTL